MGPDSLGVGTPVRSADGAAIGVITGLLVLQLLRQLGLVV